MIGINHSVVAGKSNNPNYDVSANAWNVDHTIANNSIPVSAIASGIMRFVTKIGTKTIVSGNTAVTITHGLGYTPDISQIFFVPQDDLGGRGAYVSNITGTTFDLNINSSDQINHTFSVFVC